MSWNNGPPWYPMGYPMPMPAPDTKSEYVAYLKKQLKDIKKTDATKKDDKKKKPWWQNAEIVAFAFFSAPFLAPVYIGVIKLSWMLCQSMLK